MTYGTFGIFPETRDENLDVRENKAITITDGRELKRDDGSHQWDQA